MEYRQVPLMPPVAVKAVADQIAPLQKRKRKLHRMRVEILNPTDGGRGCTSMERALQFVKDGIAVFEGGALRFRVPPLRANSPRKRMTIDPDRVATVGARLTARVSAERNQRVDAAAGSHTDFEWAAIIAAYGNVCLRCGVSGNDDPLTKDHVVPLIMGGTNYASNIQPLCRSCNTWKGIREIDFRTIYARTA